jgi:hypothetical protein
MKYLKYLNLKLKELFVIAIAAGITRDIIGSIIYKTSGYKIDSKTFTGYTLELLIGAALLVIFYKLFILIFKKEKSN